MFYAYPNKLALVDFACPSLLCHNKRKKIPFLLLSHRLQFLSHHHSSAVTHSFAGFGFNNENF